MQKITPFLWFDDKAEEAVAFYTSIFKNSKIGNIARYGDAGAEVSGRAKGTVMTVAFQWQVVPTVLSEMLTDSDLKRAERVMGVGLFQSCINFDSGGEPVAECLDRLELLGTGAAIWPRIP